MDEFISDAAMIGYEAPTPIPEQPVKPIVPAKHPDTDVAQFVTANKAHDVLIPDNYQG